jgi:hypothetical protein
MGFMSDLATLARVGGQSYDNLDVKGRMAAAKAQMDAFNHASAPIDPQAEARRVPARATVTSCAPTGVVVNFNPVVALELMVFIGGVALPVHTSSVVAQVHLPRVQPGSELAVSVDPADPSSLRIDWSR